MSPPHNHSLFDELESEPTKYDPTKKVPNLFPTITNVPYRLAIIGEAPGSDEVDLGVPFIGASGRELDRFLSRFGILRDACFIGNVCQQRPISNKIATFDWDGKEIQEGLKQLHEDLKKFNPFCILLLGGSALHAFRHPDIIPKKRKDKDGLKFVFPDSISDWRGSFFTAHSNSPAPSVKCISSFHPAATMRQYEWTPYLMMDIQRAFSESTFPELILPEEDYDVELNFERICKNLDNCYEKDTYLGTDIEGYWGNWKCIAFANAPGKAFIVPFVGMDNQSLWTLEEEVTLFEKVTNILSSTKITKVWQNGLYDRFVLQYGYSIIVRGLSNDIMLKHWELYCELEKALSVQCSIYTKKPFYKTDLKTDNQATFWRYCCRDAAVTLEIDQKLDKYLNDESKRHYQFNLVLLNALLYMQLRGLRFNIPLAEKRLNEIQHQIYLLQYRLDQATSFGIRTKDKTVLRAIIRDTMCYKRDSSQVKADYQNGTFDWCMRVCLGEGELSESECGRLSISLGLSLNIEGKSFKPYIYETLNLPIQKSATTGNPTTDYEALQTLLRACKEKSKSTEKSQREKAIEFLPIAIELGELRTRAEHIRSMIQCSSDFNNDGRLHGSYNEVGSETGRITVGKFLKKYGYPLQTVEDENELKPVGHPLRLGLRDLVISDPDKVLAKCDLKGADGWTIGANLAALGNDTMLEDLKFGIKPAHIPAWVLLHDYTQIPGKTRQQLKDMFKSISKESWQYFGAKQTIWGYCYLMGVDKSISTVYKTSEGTVLLTSEQGQQLKQSVFRRYQPDLWHRALLDRLTCQPYPPTMTYPSGHTRKFFGRKSEILGEALASEPQEVTTYATNQAVFKCWTDPENRQYKPIGGCRLYVEPMHQVHDEFLSQIDNERIIWGVDKIKSWFNNPIKIVGVTVTIPFDGSYGTNWSMNEEGKKGSI